MGSGRAYVTVDVADFLAGRRREPDPGPPPLCCGRCGVPMATDHHTERERCYLCDSHADHETLAGLKVRHGVDVTSEPAEVRWHKFLGLHHAPGRRPWPWIDPPERARRAVAAALAAARRAREAATRVVLDRLMDAVIATDGAEHLIAHDCPEAGVHRRYWLHRGEERTVVGDVLDDGSWRWPRPALDPVSSRTYRVRPDNDPTPLTRLTGLP